MRRHGGERFVVRLGRDWEATRYGRKFEIVSHGDERLTPLIDNIGDTQRKFDAHVVSQQAAPRLNAPRLHSVPVRLAARLPGGYAGHGTQVQFEQQDRVDGFTTSYTNAEGLGSGRDG